MAVNIILFDMISAQQRVEVVETGRACIVVPQFPGNSSWE